MAVATRVSAAKLDYCQLSLAEIVAGFSLKVREVSAIPTVIQIGYPLRLALSVPFDELMERRRLIVARGSATVPRECLPPAVRCNPVLRSFYLHLGARRGNPLRWRW